MAKRFGRNSRRAMKAEISMAIAQVANALRTEAATRLQLNETRDELARALRGPYVMAEGTEILPIPLANVWSFTDTTDWSRREGRVERTASVLLIDFSMTEGLMDALDDRWRRRSGLVSFRGCAWQIDSLEHGGSRNSYDSIMDSALGPAITVNMRAVTTGPSREPF